MKIEIKEVKKMRITDIPHLDVITVIFEDIAKGCGKIIIEYFSQSWAYTWGAIEDRTIEEFVNMCDTDYLIGNMFFCCII